MNPNRNLRTGLCLALLLCLLVGLLPAPAAYAASNSGSCGKDGDNLTWTLDADGTLTISGEGEMADYSSTRKPPWSTSITLVRIEDGVTSIGDRAFFGCTKLSSVELPDSLTDIGDSAFYNCKSLTSVTIPDSVTAIGDYAFSFCDGLSSITIPDSLTDIGDSAFYDCDSLTSITIPDSVTSIGINPFTGCSALKIRVSPKHPVLAVIDGVLFSKPDKRLISYPSARKTHEYAIPDGIHGIGDHAFSHCDSLTSIAIPDSVTSIEYAAFYSCGSLSSVTIPDSVTSIGKDAFANCPLLTLTVERDSFAERYCVENALDYMFPDALDWLKD